MSYIAWPVHIFCVYGIAHLWAIFHGLYIFSVFKVSHTYEIIEALMEYERDIMSGNVSPSDAATVILTVNPVIEVTACL